MFMLAYRKFKYFILRHIIKPFILFSAYKQIIPYCTYNRPPENEPTCIKHSEDDVEFNVLV